MTASAVLASHLLKPRYCAGIPEQYFYYPPPIPEKMFQVAQPQCVSYQILGATSLRRGVVFDYRQLDKPIDQFNLKRTDSGSNSRVVMIVSSLYLSAYFFDTQSLLLKVDFCILFCATDPVESQTLKQRQVLFRSIPVIKQDKLGSYSTTGQLPNHYSSQLILAALVGSTAETHSALCSLESLLASFVGCSTQFPWLREVCWFASSLALATAFSSALVLKSFGPLLPKCKQQPCGQKAVGPNYKDNPLSKCVAIEAVIIVSKTESDLTSKRFGNEHIIYNKIALHSRCLNKTHTQDSPLRDTPTQALKHPTQLVVRDNPNTGSNSGYSHILLSDQACDVDSQHQPKLLRHQREISCDKTESLYQFYNQIKRCPSVLWQLCCKMLLCREHSVCPPLSQFLLLRQALCSFFIFNSKNYKTFAFAA